MTVIYKNKNKIINKNNRYEKNIFKIDKILYL